MICHGGSGTTLAALAAGLPLVVIPLQADQPTNAATVEEIGAGIAVRPTAATDQGRSGLDPHDVPQVRAAVRAVLTNATYTQSAEQIARALADRPPVSDALHSLRNNRP